MSIMFVYAPNGPDEKCAQNWVEPLGFPHGSDPKIQIRRREVCGRIFLLLDLPNADAHFLMRRSGFLWKERLFEEER
jgi:hypothetical protein